MNEEQEITSIDNWACYGSRSVMIVLSKISQDSEIFYQPSLSICLDDGTPAADSYKQEKNIDIILDMVDACPRRITRNVAFSIMNLFQNISDVVMVLDANGTVVDDEEMRLEELLEDEIPTATPCRAPLYTLH